jgi:3-oxoacyl-[acyl-carrier-protein] synthase-1
MTAPHPDGAGAQAAMQMALKQAGLKTDDIGYLNLHATGTKMNDASEMKAVHAVFGADITCSGTKGTTGHTLGAAGAIESIISLLALEHGVLPGTNRLKQLDDNFKCRVLYKPEHVKVDKVMSNNFGFGGNNACLIFGRDLHE